MSPFSVPQSFAQEIYCWFKKTILLWLSLGSGLHSAVYLNSSWETICLHKSWSIPVEVKWSEVKSLSRVRLFATPWTVAHQAPPSMGFTRQEYWSGLPFPSPGDRPNPGIEPSSPALQADALTSELPGKHLNPDWFWQIIPLKHFAKSHLNSSVSRMNFV